MNAKLILMTATGLGAGLMFILDPNRGRHRRARVRDKAVRTMNKGTDALDCAYRDLTNRVRRLVAELASCCQREAAPDDVMMQRVRSTLGRYVHIQLLSRLKRQMASWSYEAFIFVDQSQGLDTPLHQVCGMLPLR